MAHALLQKWGLPTDFEERTPLCSEYVAEIGWLSPFLEMGQTGRIRWAVSLIVNGRRSITADTAMRLAHYFGTSAQMWMNLQTAYDLEIAQKKAAAIKREVIPASKRAA